MGVQIRTAPLQAPGSIAAWLRAAAEKPKAQDVISMAATHLWPEAANACAGSEGLAGRGSRRASGFQFARQMEEAIAAFDPAGHALADHRAGAEKAGQRRLAPGRVVTM